MTCWRTRSRSAPSFTQHLGGDAFALANETEQDVLGADVVVTKLQRLAQREFEHLLGARSERDVTAGCLLALTDDLFDLFAHRLQRDVQRLERLGRHAFAFVDEAEQDVLGADVVVVESLGLFLCQYEDASGPVCKAFEHCQPRGLNRECTGARRALFLAELGPSDHGERRPEGGRV
jgi:hypothetical protein